MHRYFLLTPVSQDGYTNPGSIFITDGIKHLIRAADPRAAFYNLNMLRHHPDEWELAYDQADVLVFCGNPRFNATERKVYWDWNIWHHINTAKQHGILVADLWAGAAYPYPLPSIEKMTQHILGLEKTKAVLEHYRNVDLVVTRDALAQAVLETVHPDCLLLPCSTWWAREYRDVAPGQKEYNCLTFATLHVAGVRGIVAAIERIAKRLESDKPTFLLAHAIHEYRWLRGRIRDAANLICCYNQRDLLKFYSKVDKLVSFRLHGSIPALSLGAQVCNVVTDARALTMEPFQVPSADFNAMLQETVDPAFHCCDGVPQDAVDRFVAAFQERIVTRIQDSARCRGPRARSIHFGHGLGDVANFAHSLPLYVRRGYRLTITCTPDKAFLFSGTGVEVDTARHGLHHPWPEPDVSRKPDSGKPWRQNKCGLNLSQPPMPHIGVDDDLWREYCDSRIDIRPFVGEQVVDEVRTYLSCLRGPTILLHTMGNTGQGLKNLSNELTRDLYRRLVDRTDGTVILLDWDNRVPRLASGRLRHLEDDWKKLTTEELLALLFEADLLIGVDSGPLHAVRYTDTPAIGLWTKRHPANFLLPRMNTLNLTPREGFVEKNRLNRVPYNIVECGDEALVADTVARLAVRMLDQPRYLSRETIAWDVQLQEFVANTSGGWNTMNSYVDRGRSFDLLLRAVSNRFVDPVIVETGTIRVEDDWSAGFSTYLFGLYCMRRGAGNVLSIDNSPEHCKFARNVTRVFDGRVEIVEGCGAERLSQIDRDIDVLYLDSLDTDNRQHAEENFRELMSAYRKLGEASIILIDDTPWSGGEFKGKGAKSVPWLLERGWRVAYAGYQVMLTRQNDSGAVRDSETAVSS